MVRAREGSISGLKSARTRAFLLGLCRLCSHHKSDRNFRTTKKVLFILHLLPNTRARTILDITYTAFHPQLHQGGQLRTSIAPK